MTTTPKTTASGAADDLHPVFTRVLPDLPDTKPFTLFKAGFRQALATMASAPVAPTMVDMVPPATSRDRWMYEQGRLAERDPRTSQAAPVAPAPQPAAPLTDTFVQTVPDKCDRIVWRNNYYHLPIAAAPKAAPAELPDAVAHYGGVFTDEQLGMKPAPLQQDEYLPLPEPDTHCYDEDTRTDVWSYSASQMHAAIDAHLAARGAAQAAPLQQGEYPGLPQGDVNTGVGEMWNRHSMRAYVDDDRAARGAAQAAPDNRVPEAWTNLLAYALQDDMHNRLTPRVVDIAYTAFMQAKRPNDEDGGASDWFNDTKPKVAEMIAKLRKDLIEELAAQPAPIAEDAEIRKALDDAATSLETISRIAGRDKDMLGMMDVRLYAAARAKVAREAQAAQPEGGA